MFSVKSKTIILVLAIYFILLIVFFTIRYRDIKDFTKKSQETEFQKINKIYNTSPERVSKFYITRGYANINSYGIKDAFENNDSKALHLLSQPRWRVMTKENRYLKTFSFYDRDAHLLTYFGQYPGQELHYVKYHKKSLSGFWYYHDSFEYHAVAVVRKADTKKIVGYINFTLDPVYFLSEIKKLTSIEAFEVFQRPDKKKIFFLLLKHPQVLDKVIKENIFMKNREIQIDGSVYMPYVINGIGMDADNNFKIIFIQNISHGKAVVKKALIQSLIVLMLTALFTTMIISYGFDIILKELNESNARLTESRNEFKHLNDSLQIKIKEEIEQKLKKEREANEKERMLAHQSRLASMGEMIGNIAHQWRQPLTEISSILINLELHFEKNKLTKDKFATKVKEANEQISFMSKTIDDFRNFFASKKQKQTYKISDVVGRVHRLLDASLKNHNIHLDIVIVDDYEVFGFPNEIAQALLNIVSNAKDILLERKINNANISTRVLIDNEKKIIAIEDNAGGITIEPIDKIFEPYFSTKHAKSGTGIGLYMTKTIIEKNNHGTIAVSNTKQGALFTITL